MLMDVFTRARATGCIAGADKLHRGILTDIASRLLIRPPLRPRPAPPSRSPFPSRGLPSARSLSLFRAGKLSPGSSSLSATISRGKADTLGGDLWDKTTMQSALSGRSIVGKQSLSNSVAARPNENRELVHPSTSPDTECHLIGAR